MIVELEKPLRLTSGSVVSVVTVQVPAEHTWDLPPPGTDQAQWNLACFAGIPVEAVPDLTEWDIERIGTAAQTVMAVWNAFALTRRPAVTSPLSQLRGGSSLSCGG